MKFSTHKVFLVIFSIFMAVSASATTYVLNPDGTGDFATIQDAVYASQNGDIIELADGTYTPATMGNNDYGIYFGGKAITLCSQSGNPENCILDVQGQENEVNERAFLFSAGEDRESIVRDLTITHGSADAC